MNPDLIQRPIAREAKHPELIQRAVLHYAEYLEFLDNERVQEIQGKDAAMCRIEAFLWTTVPFAADDDQRAEAIIEELKRRGLGNGKVGE